MASSEQKPSGFTVTDRRTFTPSGEQPSDAPPAGEPKPPEPPPAAAAPKSEATKAEAPKSEATKAEAPKSEATKAEGSKPLPPVDFSTFVLSLGSSALMHLGELENPESGKPQKDLVLAKHTIDLLSMLQAKTKGNLNAQEDKLLESLLFDLRLRYVSAAKGSG
jgi:hypothetical protein